MSALICDICGGKLLVVSGGIAKCDSCGTEHTKERVQEKAQEIKGMVRVEGAVETVKGDAEKERLLKNAETNINLGNYKQAEKIYRQITNDYPDDYRGWWGIVVVETNNLTSFGFLSKPDYNLKLEIEGYVPYQNSLKLSNDMMRKIIKDSFLSGLNGATGKLNNYWDGLIQQVMDGTIKAEDFEKLKNGSDKAKYLYQNACALAKKVYELFPKNKKNPYSTSKWGEKWEVSDETKREFALKMAGDDKKEFDGIRPHCLAAIMGKTIIYSYTDAAGWPNQIAVKSYIHIDEKNYKEVFESLKLKRRFF